MNSTGKTRVRINYKITDLKGTHIYTKTYHDDSLESMEYRCDYQLNDTTKVILEKSDYYYHGKRRTYQNDSTIQINTPDIRKSTTWQSGGFNRSIIQKFTDSVLRYEIQEELDFSGKRKIKHESWYDEQGNLVKTVKIGKGKSTQYFSKETHFWKGTKIEETVIYEGKRKIKEKTRTEFDQRNLPQDVFYYDKNDNITSKITWEYTYW